MLTLLSILLTKPTYLTTIFTQFLTMLIMNPLLGCHAKVSVRECLSHITLPVSDVWTTLLHLNPSKSPGADGIPSLLLPIFLINP